MPQLQVDAPAEPIAGAPAGEETPAQSTALAAYPPPVVAPGAAGEPAQAASPARLLGEQPWFDVPGRVLLLLMGLIHLRAGVTDWALIALAPVLLIYLALNAHALLRALPAGRSLLRHLGLPLDATTGRPQLFNFALDAAWVTVVSLGGPHDASLTLPLMSLLAAGRLFAGGPGRSGRLLAPPILLALLSVAVRLPYSAGGPGLAMALTREIVLTLSLVCLLYLFARRVNLGMHTVAELTSAVAERDHLLGAAQQQAQMDARLLAEQVLRLTVLQDGIAAMNSAVALDDLLQMVVANAVRVLGAEQSSIGLVDEATGELVVQAATGVKASTLRRQRFGPGVGVAGWVVQHGEPLMVGDVLQDPRYVQPYGDKTAGLPTTRNILCVPLMVEHRVIGALSATHSRPHALQQDDQRILISFAEQAALAVYKTRLLDERTRQSEELRRRGEIISSLMSIRQAVTSSLDLSRVLDTTISRVGELIPFDFGYVHLTEPRTGATGVAISAGPLPPPADLRLEPGAPALALWERARGAGPHAAQGPHAMLIAPLVNRDTTLGCILLARGADRPFTELECDVADQLAGAASIAVDNARLFAGQARQQQQATSLYQLMLQVSDAPKRRELAQAVCDEMQRITGGVAAALLISDPVAGRFTGWATSGAWRERREIHSVVLAAHGDPFLSNILAALQQQDSPDLLIFPDVPPQGRHVFGATGCVTIPLTMGRRIYGLLVLQPSGAPPISADLRETVTLAISHCTVALERAELFEQTLASARQSGILHKIATEVQASLDLDTVVQTTASGSLMALPIDSCEVYLLDSDRQALARRAVAATRAVQETGWRQGPEHIQVADSPSVLEALRSPGLISMDLDERPGTAARDVSVVLGRLMGGEEPLGIVRLTTMLPADEFVRRHATFCQTLWMHSGGAIDRSHLYSMASAQARTLQRRAQQLTDILNFGALSAADEPLTTLLPHIAEGIAASLGFAHVEIGEIDAEGSAQEWHGADPTAAPSGQPLAPVPLSLLELLLEAGHSPEPGFRGVYLEESLLVQSMRGAQAPLARPAAYPLILMPLESTSGDILGYLLAAPDPEHARADAPTERELLEVLSIFAQRIAMIMDNHRIYRQLSTSKRKIESVVYSISDGVIVTDAELNVLITNRLADRLLGAPAEVTLNAPLRRFIHSQPLLSVAEDCLASGESRAEDVELRLGREDRTYQAVAHSIESPDFGSLGVVLTLRDVTLERAAERAKSDFLSIVSHELRTPLNSIMGFLDIILMGKTGELNELQNDFLSTAKQESQALHRLIGDILDYSQVQSRMLNLVLLPMNLSAAITRVVNQAIPRMTEDELRLVNNVPPEILVVGDELRLEQVFKNLLDNAAKFTNPGGEIVFNALLTATTVIIEVKDSGCGIPPAQVAHVFDRFFQAENNSNRRKRGLGLGLAICQNMIEAHNGRIWIESALDVGTSVFVELTLFKPSDEPFDPHTAPDQAAGQPSAPGAPRPARG
jgi:signal transduction histidine kinase/putative methionine-R-sulfoxide reductase with GAF domain